MDKTRTVVKICGKEYTMAGFESEEYIHRVAIYVDRKMSELKSQYVNLNTSTLAVLAALNVADDLLKLQDQMEALTQEYQVLSEELKEGAERLCCRSGQPSRQCLEAGQRAAPDI